MGGQQSSVACCSIDDASSRPLGPVVTQRCAFDCVPVAA
eukprot:COSAG02_NODE_33095_length_505_cov_1.142857_1_plen_38_part_01